MSINSPPITGGLGVLFVNERVLSIRPASLLKGHVDLDAGIADGRSEKELRVNAEAHIAADSDEFFYRLRVGGLVGVLQPQIDAKGGPHYRGTLGPNRELEVAGWHSQGDGGSRPYILLLIWRRHSILHVDVGHTPSSGPSNRP